MENLNKLNLEKITCEESKSIKGGLIFALFSYASYAFVTAAVVAVVAIPAYAGWRDGG